MQCRAYAWFMSTHSLMEARSRLSDLIDRARHGEAVVITRHGKPVAELRALPTEARHVTQADLAWLDARRVPRRNPAEDAGVQLRRLRDQDER